MSKTKPEHPIAQKVSPVFVLTLAVIGVCLNEASVSWSLHYWLVCFGLTGLTISVHAVSLTGGAFWKHFLGWCGAVVALALVYLMNEVGRIGDSVAGLMCVLLLGLSLFMDGISVQFRYALVGLYLLIAVAIMALIEAFIWWFILLTIAFFAFEIYWLGFRKKHD